MDCSKTILACLLQLMVLSAEGRQPVLHRVGGGRFSWNPYINLTEWAIHEQFYVGDWLYFGFDKKLYTVVQVNKRSYETCIEENFIKNITKGGRDVFNLTEAKPYYFISGGGYCFKGMKVAIVVQDYPSSPLTNGYLPPANTNGSLPITISSASNSPGKLILLISYVWFLFVLVTPITDVNVFEHICS